jgi:hypothetical protein
VAIQNRVTQDRRKISRVPARLACRFSLNGENHDATLLDLSFNGAFLSSKFLPPTGSSICLNLQTPSMKKSLDLDATVLRGSSVNSDHGTLSRFAIRFHSSSLDLMKLVQQLIS